MSVRPLRSGLLAVAAMAAVLAGLELGLRLLAPQTRPLEGLFRDDAAIGPRHVPLFRGRMRVEGREAEVAISAQGFRDREYPPPGNAYRVLGLGDSFAFGFGVAEEQSYLSRIEALLAKERVEVINAGHLGWGPDNEARLLESEGEALRPRLVLVGFFVGNDLWNVLSGPDRALVREGVLVSRPGVLERWDRPLQPGRILPRVVTTASASDAEPSAWRRLLRRSHAFRFLSRRFATLRARLGPPRTGGGPSPLTPLDEEAVFIRQDPPEFTEGWARVKGLIARMDGWCLDHQAVLAVAVIPTATQVEPGRWAEARLRHRLREEDFDLGKPQRILSEFGQDLHVAVIDLLPALRRAAAESGEPLYFRHDPHWTAHGHDVAARALVEELRGRGLLP